MPQKYILIYGTFFARAGLSLSAGKLAVRTATGEHH
jgi:hypothetical protein